MTSTEYESSCMCCDTHIIRVVYHGDISSLSGFGNLLPLVLAGWYFGQYSVFAGTSET
jgi:hypothetical protein